VLVHFIERPDIRQLALERLQSSINADARKVLQQAVTLSFDEIQSIISAIESKLGKPPRQWLDLASLPALYWQKDGSPVPLSSIQYLFFIQNIDNEFRLCQQARTLLDQTSSTERATFATALFNMVEKAGIDSKSRFALPIIGYLMDEDVITELKSWGMHTNINAVTTLGFSQLDAAAQALDAIAKQFSVKYPNVREAAEEGLEQIASARGISSTQLYETLIPDFGFSQRQQAWDIAGDAFQLFIDSDLSFKFINPKGKTVKSLPKAASNEQKASFKDLKQQLTDAKKSMQPLLRDWMVNKRHWPKDEWIAFFLNHPLLFNYARSLVWGVYCDGELLESFQVSERITLQNLEGHSLDLYADDWESDFWCFLGMYGPKPYHMRSDRKSLEIGLVHPVELSDQQLSHWRTRFAQQKVQQPILQLDQPTYRKCDKVKDLKIDWRFENKPIKRFSFDKRGWRRGSVVDAGGVSGYKRQFRHFDIETFIMLEDVNVREPGTGQLKQLFFVPKGSVYTGSYVYDEPQNDSDNRLIAFEALPDIVYSDTLADLHYFMGE
jgi:hypothetical protein